MGTGIGDLRSQVGKICIRVAALLLLERGKRTKMGLLVQILDGVSEGGRGSDLWGIMQAIMSGKG